MRRLLIIALLLLAAAVALIVRRGAASLDEPLAVSSPMVFRVAPGARFSRVAMDLARRGVVAQPRAWIVYARWQGLAPLIKAGEYAVDPGLTPRGLLERMVNGQVILHSLTIVDGWAFKDLLQALQKNPDIVKTLGADGAGIMEKLGSPGIAPEGQFLPETYRFPAGTVDLEVLRQAHAALTVVLNSAWAQRDPAVPAKSAAELLIMASIIEKESGLTQELPTIAGLYWHRFSIGMRLQADPTVIYGLGNAYDGELHTVDLRTDGPYNTYTRVGLPPTPIALAGERVIRATARPDKTDALYFVASGRADGSHVFSATLDAHNAAVAQYLARMRQKATAVAQ